MERLDQGDHIDLSDEQRELISRHDVQLHFVKQIIDIGRGKIQQIKDEPHIYKERDLYGFRRIYQNLPVLYSKFKACLKSEGLPDFVSEYDNLVSEELFELAKYASSSEKKREELAGAVSLFVMAAATILIPICMDVDTYLAIILAIIALVFFLIGLGILVFDRLSLNDLEYSIAGYKFLEPNDIPVYETVARGVRDAIFAGLKGDYYNDTQINLQRFIGALDFNLNEKLALKQAIIDSSLVIGERDLHSEVQYALAGIELKHLRNYYPKMSRKLFNEGVDSLRKSLAIMEIRQIKEPALDIEVLYELIAHIVVKHLATDPKEVESARLSLESLARNIRYVEEDVAVVVEEIVPVLA